MKYIHFVYLTLLFNLVLLINNIKLIYQEQPNWPAFTFNIIAISCFVIILIIYYKVINKNKHGI